MTIESEENNCTDSTVKVALRIRPQNARERLQMNQICTSVTSNEPQIFIGKDKAFTFDYVFNSLSKQEDIFSMLSRPLIDGCLEGYNATILAYGQTGSGKTYTMGSGFDVSIDPLDIGIIPRSIQYLFDKIDNIKMDYKKKMLPVPDFKIVTQFLELYNEELIDLFSIIPENKNQKSHIKIHEDSGGSIYLTGVSTRLVASLEDTLKCLKDGSLCRSTASTNMNSQSSRSHAIFTLHIKQQRLLNANDSLSIENNSDFETLTAKFHFVDLAGSERLKRTGATGERAKEGISINCGLLALGNVISILGDNSKNNSHVPYRNSKLTRLLQDSLGGNSQTIMIACISPSDCDFLETLNTLNYANRTRNIKNKVTVNQDKTSKQFTAMRIQIENLEAELLQYKQGRKTAESSNEGGISDIYVENNILQCENHNSRLKIKSLSDTIDALKSRNSQILAEKEAFIWQYKKENIDHTKINEFDFESDEVMKVIEKYTMEVEELRAKLAESEAMVTVLQRSNRSYFNMENSKQSHISITNEFPEDDSVFERSVLKWEATLTKKKKVKKSQIQNNGNDENDELLIPTICETGDDIPGVVSPSSDIDKDSLNGDIGERSDNENSYDDDSDTENQDAENYLHQSLATLSSEIDVKKRLISELQGKQKQLRKIREHYEEQLHALNNKIKETESERDQVLANLGEVEVTNEERVRKVRLEYEKKLANLKVELNQLQTAKREHTLMLKNQQRKDHELRLLQNELNELKSLKVQLTKKLREETKRTREVDNVHNKEIIQLRKEKRMADNQIRNLEQEKVRKDLVLKRKQEEVESLRRRQNKFGTDSKLSYKSNPISVSSSVTISASTSRTISKTPYKTAKPHARRNSILARVTKSKLNSIENALKKTIIRRHTMNGFEQDLNTRVREREKLSKKLQILEFHCQKNIKDKKSTDDIFYEMKNLKSQIETLQEEINECQSNILDMEESKLEESVSDIISKCSLDEAHYLLEQVYQITVNKGILAQTLESQESALKFELKNKIQEREQALDMLRIALQHSTVPFDMDGVFADGSDEEEDDALDVSELSPIINSASIKHVSTYHDEIPRLDNKKMKRKQATTEELLGVNTISEKSFPNFNLENNNNSSLTSPFLRTLNSVESINDNLIDYNQCVQNAWKDITNDNTNDVVAPRSPQRKHLTWKHPGGSMTTSLIVSKNDIFTENFIQNYNTLETPPSSPSNFRRVSSQRSQVEENVFKRLTYCGPIPNPTRGSITSSSKKNLLSSNAPLQCTHVAEGHLKEVLDIDISDNIMITGSKDRSAKIWDLTNFMEIDSLNDHQNSVTKVRYSNTLHIAYTVSTFYIKMWDLRDSKKCIRTLWSSGLSQEGPPEFSQASRQTICPPGENFIMDMTFSSNENFMFLATANSVKVWDMRRFCAIGKLHGNHQAPVMVLASGDKDRNSTTLVTGSKDHYIKVFDVSPSSVGLITPSIDLQPPHYDGVESLSLRDNILLSGSRDACIKMWDLTNGVHVASLSQAHRDWVQALCFTSDGKNFVSGCRSGVIKLWNTDNCFYIGDVQAHIGSINALKSSNDKIFSASNDRTVKIWQMTNIEQ